MSNLDEYGIQNIEGFQSFNTFPRQCIIAGKRGGSHTVTAGEAGAYFHTGFTENCVAEGRQFIDYENTQGYSNIPFIDELNLHDDKLGAMIINASVQLECSGNSRRYMQVVLNDPNDDSKLYDLSLTSGCADGSNRLNLALTTIVTPSAFSTNVWPTMQFYLQEGDIIVWWSITAIVQ